MEVQSISTFGVFLKPLDTVEFGKNNKILLRKVNFAFLDSKSKPQIRASLFL